MIQVVLLRSVLLFNVVLVCWSLVIEEEFRLFSLHPVFAVIFQVLFYEGIVALQRKTFIEKSQGGKIDLHILLQIVSYIAITVAFSVIFYNKLANGKSHFMSWHSWAGLGLFLSCSTQLILGFLVHYCPSVFPTRFLLAKGLQLHRLLGYLVNIFVLLTFVLSLYSNYILTKDLPLMFWSLIVASQLGAGLLTFVSMDQKLVFKIFN